MITLRVNTMRSCLRATHGVLESLRLDLAIELELSEKPSYQDLALYILTVEPILAQATKELTELNTRFDRDIHVHVPNNSGYLKMVLRVANLLSDMLLISSLLKLLKFGDETRAQFANQSISLAVLIMSAGVRILHRMDCGDGDDREMVEAICQRIWGELQEAREECEVRQTANRRMVKRLAEEPIFSITRSMVSHRLIDIHGTLKDIEQYLETSPDQASLG